MPIEPTRGAGALPGERAGRSGGRRPADVTAALPARRHLPVANSDRSTQTVLDVVVPVHNEEVDLEPCIRRLHAFLRGTFPYGFRITIADNASSDRTPAVAARLADACAEVDVVRIEHNVGHVFGSLVDFDDPNPFPLHRARLADSRRDMEVTGPHGQAIAARRDQAGGQP